MFFSIKIIRDALRYNPAPRGASGRGYLPTGRQAQGLVAFFYLHNKTHTKKFTKP